MGFVEEPMPSERNVGRPQTGFTMLVSLRHGYIFVHVAKTGGTSVRAALATHRLRELSYWATWLSDRVSRLSGHRLGIKIPRHAPVIVAREMLPPPTFAELYKFAFVRNPWDRLVSAFLHFQRERQDVLTRQRIDSFPDFVEFVLETPTELAPRASLLRSIQRPQLESVIGFRGELLVDYVGRFETLESDFQEVMRRLSLGEHPLPHKRQALPQRDYRSFFSDALADRVGQHFADDLAAFQYTFDAPQAASIGLSERGGGTPVIAGRIEPQDDGAQCTGSC